MTEQTNEVAVAPEAGLPAVYDDMLFAHSGKGLENLTAADMAIPYLSLLQDLSPQVKKTRAEYVEGAEPGMMINTLTNQIYKSETGGVNFIPVHWDKWFTEWKPNRGGFVQRHGPEILNQCSRINGKDTLPNGNEVETAAVYYVLIVNEDKSLTKAIMTMKSTNFKISKRLAALIASQTRISEKHGPFTPPAFANLINMKSVLEQDDKNSWFLWKPEHVGFVDKLFPELGRYYFNEAQKFYEAVIKGGLKIQDPAAEDGTGNEGPASNSAGQQGTGQQAEDDIPF